MMREGSIAGWFLGFLILITAALGLSALARAQGTAPTEPDGYRALVDEAKNEYDRTNYREARALFHKAQALYPNARALRGLAMTEFELRNYTDSVVHLRQALASTIRPLEGELREESERLLERARSFIAEVEVELSPPEAAITVDGVPARIDEQRVLLLEAGTHALEFRAPGYTPERRVMKIIGGERERIEIALAREARASVVSQVAARPLEEMPREAAPATAPKRRLYKNGWLWTGVGVVAAAAAVGLAVGLGRSGEPATAAPPVANPWQTTRIR